MTKRRPTPAPRLYANSYLGKMAWHMSQGNLDSFFFFATRQTEKYGEITEEQWTYVSTEAYRLNSSKTRQAAADQRLADFNARKLARS